MNIFEDYSWHSCIEPQRDVMKKKIIRKISASSPAMSRFIKISKDGSSLIHKSTKALWRFSEDGKSIEPVFKDDILTEDEL